ncbi:MAG: hypothetical protein KGI59_02795, partial [Patescibacteria group bacterium]|nr:hypothetical protein [Patescibacteria group bacterium]
SWLAGMAAHLLLSYELFMVMNFARLPFAAIHVDTFPFAYVAVFYAAFFAGYVIVVFRRRSSSH